MMKSQMDKLDIPPVEEFLEMIAAGGGEIYACKLAMDMFKLKSRSPPGGKGCPHRWAIL